MMECSVTGCSSSAKKRGWCDKHYARWIRTGDLMNHGKWFKSNDMDERLTHTGWTEVVRVAELGPCWEWNGSRRKGYGRMSVSNKSTAVHRVAYETWVGPIPEGLVVRHRCDNSLCINPEHLEPGTVRDNSQDMVMRGRTNPRKGSAHGQSKLVESDISWVRYWLRGGYTQKTIADVFGVSQKTISNINLGRIWKEAG